jgi:D-alanyl-D-alanine carboxypeptidase (penicillin-binding protein 5/6)
MFSVIHRPFFLQIVLSLGVLFSFPALPATAETLETAARQAIVVDFSTGAVLMEKNADEMMTPSSMSKLMTVYMVFARLKEGSLKLGDELPVTETAWKKHYKTEGSLMFLPVHSTARVDDLLRGVIIQSGNDACSVLAEGLTGSEEAFAERATQLSREIGLTRSVFRNASGWPEPGHQMTARDLAILARRLIADFPDYYPIFAERDFTYNNIKQDNRNPLIWQNIVGADGLKTGHTDEGGYGLTGSAVRDGRRVIVVMNGLPSIKSRAEESQRLIEWAFREFDDYTLVKAGEAVAEAPVTLGMAKTVPAVVAADVTVTLPRTARRDVKIAHAIDGPVAAPVARGTRVGTATVSAPGRPDVQVALVAATDVERLGFFARMGASVKGLLWAEK